MQEYRGVSKSMICTGYIACILHILWLYRHGGIGLYGIGVQGVYRLMCRALVLVWLHTDTGHVHAALAYARTMSAGAQHGVDVRTVSAYSTAIAEHVRCT